MIKVSEDKNYTISTQNKFFTRKWLKTRVCESELLYVVHEFYVPWYAWPMELIYRLIFGRSVLKPISDKGV